MSSRLWEDKPTITKILTAWQTLDAPALQWRHSERDGTSNHQHIDCLFNRLFRLISKKTQELLITGLCAGSSPVTSELPHKGPVTRKMFPFDDVIMMHVKFHGCESVCWIMVFMNSYYRSRISMLPADGLAPIWSRDTCSNKAVGRSLYADNRDSLMLNGQQVIFYVTDGRRLYKI